MHTRHFLKFEVYGPIFHRKKFFQTIDEQPGTWIMIKDARMSNLDENFFSLREEMTNKRFSPDIVTKSDIANKDRFQNKTS
ncbi:MAG: hypothetical protein A2Y28_03905 [Chlamydiae bacterium GWC2_50_10]|nr:MAG: hypothetical protein A2Z85_02015 [Chlamydiae bacterium GWA2_50_15]OGN54701.1 MAG: hypothetical protein A2Y28_03905 [Chlamydiae bacterium GWC2_50_10]OGN55167.1 MAG: hypothetical protein A2098_01570 [Chlamydiae bacterium GWF2_49_8]OGN58084.1 MAG: hypothetical protein A3D18_03160 [Chlamydiae bacterium RIFCSPHIGHO2_02_FULL_49_29]OGN62922.1 MAG: hypothetical protein A3E26_01955 [Chlamydiae bacterium RIFCSPHIGHO2_12_FULL_49_32]OGN71592.1 MAG: hypothetical protein A3G30_00330 [Chlamydiae bact